MCQFPGNDTKNLICKILSRKFYYSQVHESVIITPPRSISQGNRSVIELLTKINTKK